MAFGRLHRKRYKPNDNENERFLLQISEKETRSGKSKVNISPPALLSRHYPGVEESNFWFAYESKEIYYPVILTTSDGRPLTSMNSRDGVEALMTLTAKTGGGNGPQTEPAVIRTSSSKGVFWFKAIKAYIFGKIEVCFQIVNKNGYFTNEQVPAPLLFTIDVSVDIHGNPAPDISKLSNLVDGSYYDYVYEESPDSGTEMGGQSEEEEEDKEKGSNNIAIGRRRTGYREEPNRNRSNRSKFSNNRRLGSGHEHEQGRGHGHVNTSMHSSGSSSGQGGRMSAPTGKSMLGNDSMSHSHNQSHRYAHSQSMHRDRSNLSKYEATTVYDEDYLFKPRYSYACTTTGSSSSSSSSSSRRRERGNESERNRYRARMNEIERDGDRYSEEAWHRAVTAVTSPSTASTTTSAADEVEEGDEEENEDVAKESIKEGQGTGVHADTGSGPGTGTGTNTYATSLSCCASATSTARLKRRLVKSEGEGEEIARKVGTTRTGKNDENAEAETAYTNLDLGSRHDLERISGEDFTDFTALETETGTRTRAGAETEGAHVPNMVSVVMVEEVTGTGVGVGVGTEAHLQEKKHTQKDKVSKPAATGGKHYSAKEREERLHRQLKLDLDKNNAVTTSTSTGTSTGNGHDHGDGPHMFVPQHALFRAVCEEDVEVEGDDSYAMFAGTAAVGNAVKSKGKSQGSKISCKNKYHNEDERERYLDSGDITVISTTTASTCASAIPSAVAIVPRSRSHSRDIDIDIDTLDDKYSYHSEEEERCGLRLESHPRMKTTSGIIGTRTRSEVKAHHTHLKQYVYGTTTQEQQKKYSMRIRDQHKSEEARTRQFQQQQQQQLHGVRSSRQKSSAAQRRQRQVEVQEQGQGQLYKGIDSGHLGLGSSSSNNSYSNSNSNGGVDVDDQWKREPLLAPLSTPVDAYSRIHYILNLQTSVDMTNMSLDVTGMLDHMLRTTRDRALYYDGNLNGNSNGTRRNNLKRVSQTKTYMSKPLATQEMQIEMEMNRGFGNEGEREGEGEAQGQREIIYKDMSSRATQLRGMLNAKLALDSALFSFLCQQSMTA